MVEPDDERAWVTASRRGDQDAFAALMFRHQKMIHALTYRMTGSMDDADDLAQETFVLAYRKLASFREEARFSSWLYQIAVNLCLNWRKGRQRRDQLDQAWMAESDGPAGPTGADPGTGPDGVTRVQAALLRLPAKQRAALVLTVYDGLSHAEAGRALACSETTVSWRIFVARQKLRRWLRSETPRNQCPP